MLPMSRTFWQMLQDYLDDTGATEASVMRRAGLNKGAFAAWRRRGIPALPEPGQLVRLARAIKVDYDELLTAILHETGHLPASTAETFASLDDSDDVDVRNWVRAMVALGEYAALVGNDAHQVRSLINQDLHSNNSTAEQLANAVIARAVIEGRLYPPDAVWDVLESAELKRLVQSLWAAQRKRLKVVGAGSVGSSSEVRLDPELEADLEASLRQAARAGTRQRSVTDRPQDAAGEESQDPGTVDPA
jgi:hypothetical protein